MGGSWVEPLSVARWLLFDRLASESGFGQAILWAYVTGSTKELPDDSGALQWALAGGAHDAFVVQFNVALARKLPTASRACVREKRRRRTAVDNPPPAEIAPSGP